jgi:hypothetical protein
VGRYGGIRAFTSQSRLEVIAADDEPRITARTRATRSELIADGGLYYQLVKDQRMEPHERAGYLRPANLKRAICFVPPRPCVGT